MNLLIIGNGFDLAHNLPTKYTDFLKYCRDYSNDKILESDKITEEFQLFVSDNIWLKYFLDLTVDLDNSRTWIDYEKEVAEVVRFFDTENIEIEHAHYFNSPSEIIIKLSQNGISDKLKLFISLMGDYDDNEKKYTIKINDITDTKALVNYLYSQFRIFARAFEIYCLSINIIAISNTIISTERKEQIAKADFDRETYTHQERLARGGSLRRSDATELANKRDAAMKRSGELISGIKVIDYLSMSKFDCVLSFNYTNTYERLYGSEKTQYCYIHGKAQYDKHNTNLILGIDDDLPHGEESKNFKWIRFKKYYQRIIFKTGSEYKDWINSSTNQTPNQNYVYIVGHSLDRTDYDVLYEIFSNNRFKIIVYYYSLNDFEDKVQKVIQLLSYKGGNGRDELIRRVHGNSWSIKFIDQYDESEGLFISLKS